MNIKYKLVPSRITNLRFNGQRSYFLYVIFRSVEGGKRYMAVVNGKPNSSVGLPSGRHHRIRPPGRLDRQVEQDITI